MLSADPDRPCAEVDELARRHLHDIEERLADLGRLRERLLEATTDARDGRIAECGVLGALFHDAV